METIQQKIDDMKSREPQEALWRSEATMQLCIIGACSLILSNENSEVTSPLSALSHEELVEAASGLKNAFEDYKLFGEAARDDMYEGGQMGYKAWQNTAHNLKAELQEVQRTLQSAQREIEALKLELESLKSPVVVHGRQPQKRAKGGTNKTPYRKTTVNGGM